MSVIIFLVILIVLILVHEWGHYFTAKRIGARVDEFGIGFPPRAAKLGVRRGTLFTLNWIPFGGFVRIFGEQPENDTDNDPAAFYMKPKWKQAIVLIAGVAANFVLAALLFGVSYTLGTPSSVTAKDAPGVTDARLLVTSVLPETPAALAGISTGDEIVSANIDSIETKFLTVEEFQNFIAGTGEREILLTIRRHGNLENIYLSPQVSNGTLRIGVGIDMVGTKKYSPPRALLEGFKMAGVLTKDTAVAFAVLIAGAFSGTADLSQVTGPVGIVKAVGDASSFGISYLLAFTALISINLVVINLIPVPALDGGRLLFLIIEAARGRRIPVKVSQIAGAMSFAALILLMIVVTINDIGHLF